MTVTIHCACVGERNWTLVTFASTSPNVDRFSERFHRGLRNLQQNGCDPTHRILNASAHYLVKYVCSKITVLQSRVKPWMIDVQSIADSASWRVKMVCTKLIIFWPQTEGHWVYDRNMLLVQTFSVCHKSDIRRYRVLAFSEDSVTLCMGAWDHRPSWYCSQLC